MTSRARLTGLWRTVTAFAAVILATSATLAGLNALPEWVGNNPLRVRTAATVSAAETALGQGLWLPAYYPEWLAYPPAAVRYVVGPPPVVGIDLRARESGEQALAFVQANGASALVPVTLLPFAERSDGSSLRVSGNAATLATIRLADGARWRELAWSDGDRRYVIRYRGHDADVLRMARSLRKERP